MSKVYLAGPMRGIHNHNAEAFAYATKKLREIGHSVISPNEEDDLATIGYDFTQEELARVILQDCNFICHDTDTLALLPCWEKSKGARVEFALAEFMSRKICHSHGNAASLAYLKRKLAGQLLDEALQHDRESNKSSISA